MAYNSHFVEEHVSNHVAHEVQTPMGDFFVTYLGGEAAVSFHPRYKDHARYLCSYDEKSPQMTITMIHKRPPAVGDEVTQNGRTFEVTGVKRTNGRFMIERDGLTWEEWEA